MKCKKCGHKNKRNSQFCIACGEPLEHVSNHNWLVLILIGVMIILIISVGYAVVNNSSLNDIVPIENVVNNTTGDNASVENVVNNTTGDNASVENVVNNTVNNNDTHINTTVNKTETKSGEKNTSNMQSTINTENIESEVIEIYGVPFTVPKGGSYRSGCTYQFEFKGQLCEVEEVEHYESSDSQRTFDQYQFSKDYPGGESYSLTINNHVWKGIKVEKNNRWYHISMRTNNDVSDTKVIEMLDWMTEKNTWVGNN